MTTDVLDPAAVLHALPSQLPASQKLLKSPQDGIVALLHTMLTILSFRLIGIEPEAPPSSSILSCLPLEWNKNGPGHYALRYRHEQSSLEFSFSIVKLRTRTIINAIAVDSDKAASVDIPTDDFMSLSFFPCDLSASDAPPLVHGFISSNRIADLIFNIKCKIIQKLIPGLSKDGYTEIDDSTSATTSTDRHEPAPVRPRPDHTPPASGHRIPHGHLPSNPLEIGRRDLDPFPASPFAPPNLFPGTGGDGMFVGPDHPIFGARGGRGDQQRGPWGGDGFLPPMGAPPGARFDPVGPFPGMGGIGGRLPRGGPPGGGNMRGPDNDEFMPPGAGDMYM
jgi:proteasome inhibitor subunit 1 (PI31)